MQITIKKGRQNNCWFCEMQVSSCVRNQFHIFWTKTKKCKKSVFCGKKRSTPLVIFPIKDKKKSLLYAIHMRPKFKIKCYINSKGITIFFGQIQKKTFKDVKKSLQWVFLYISCWLLLQRIKNNLVAHGKEKGFSNFFVVVFENLTKFARKKLYVEIVF